MRVLAACDSQYFWEYGPIFCDSALENGYTPVLHVVNPTEEVIKALHILGVEAGTSPYTGRFIKNHYAHVRFLAAPYYLRNGPLLITDIDVIFRKRLPPIEEDVGVFIRENEWYPGMKSMAGIVWLQNNENGHKFIELVSKKTLSKPEEWYSDQYAIYEAYHELKETMSVHHFSNAELDWDFKPDTYIWTGKGNRKHTVKKYIQLSKEYSEKSSFPTHL